MTKRIDRARIDSGKAELPRKLSYLATEKVDFLAVLDRDGEFSVELSAKALSRLVKSRSDLKALKGEQKASGAQAADALRAEQEAHGATRRDLTKAERQLKALTRRLDAQATVSAAAAAVTSAPETSPERSPKSSPASKTPTKKTARKAMGQDHGTPPVERVPPQIAEAAAVPHDVSAESQLASAAGQALAASETPAAT